MSSRADGAGPSWSGEFQLKIIYHYSAGPEFAARLRGLRASGLEVVVCSMEDHALFARERVDTEVLWHALVPVTESVLAASPRLRLVQKIGIGVNTIDLDAARRRGVAVCNMPGTNSRAVAEATLALMLATLRQLVAFDRSTRRGAGWSWDPVVQDRLGELAGRCVGLVGYGAIPRLLAPILRALGADVIYHARSAKADAVGEFVSLPELLARADVVSLHVPLEKETQQLIDARALATMKPGSILINTARGGLVDEAALVEALRKGPLGAAGLDTFASEPTPADNPLFELDNVVVMPHVAWLTRETLDRSLAVAVENCRRLEAGEPLLHRIV
jgi:phosphoglycerate dehydrogenase-like enzyme